jgi:HD-GYP domain-containing protein (c-di-GMP phosphodiesterase class II)
MCAFTRDVGYWSDNNLPSRRLIMPVLTAAAQLLGSDRLCNASELRLSELLSAFSVSLDITEGQPLGHAMRSCLIGMRLAQHLQLSSDDQTALFYALLLKDLGCSSNAAKMCWLFGADDRVVKRDLKTVNWQRVRDTFAFARSHVAPGASTTQRMLKFIAFMREGQKGAQKLVETRCERGAEIARMLDLPEATAQAIRSLDEHWNGLGHPDRLRGAEIPLLARIACLAQTVEVFVSTEGLARALQIAYERSGTWFDPELVDALTAISADTRFWNELSHDDLQSALLQVEPADQILLANDAKIDQVCKAFAFVVDAKSPWTHKHSEGVANIAVGIAHHLGTDAATQQDIYRAGLLHDLGKLGVSNLILDKPGRPTDEEFTAIRKHPDFSEQILGRVESFRGLADVAASHHERLDGQGYHRRLSGDQIPWQGNLLAVADIYEALTAKRPYRAEMPRDAALAIMQKEVGTAIRADYFEALISWLDESNPVSRADAQLEEIDRLVASI